MTKALSIISQLPATKREQAIFVEKAVNEILAGDADIKAVYVLMDTIKKTFEAIQKDPKIKNVMEQEMSKYPEKTADFGTFTITKGQRTSYDFSNDARWVELKKELTEREGLLKAVKGKIYDDDGVELTAPISTVSEFLTIKLK